MSYETLAKEIIALMGGKENIIQSWHCITRLRFNVQEESKIEIEQIKELDGVLGAQFQSGQFQVIIGSAVTDVYAEIEKLVGNSTVESKQKATHHNLIDLVFDTISGIFTPILAAITASGLLKGIMALLVWLAVLNPESSSYLVLDAISNATFYFLPFLVATSAAKKFQTNVSLATALAGILMYPQLFGLASTGTNAISFAGILSIPLNDYSSSVLPIILGVWLMSYVEKYIKKIVPKSLTIVFVPLVTLMITAPIVLAFIAPLGTYLGSYLEIFFTSLFDIAGPVAGALMGGLMPLIVITGMHYAFFPSTFASLEKLGYDVLLLPLNLVANLAQAGATLGVFIKTKDSKMKQLAISAFIPALFGITEPAIYGVTMKLKKPFYASMIGGAIGGAIYGTFTVKAFSFAVPGLLALPTYIENGSMNFVWAIVGVASSFLTGLCLTLVFKFDTETKEKSSNSETTSIVPQVKKAATTIELPSPVSGEVVALATCPDPIFASNTMGKGFGIIPSEGCIYAPFTGTVTMLTPSKHAIGIVSDEGVELLIHVGLDTVSLNGTGFDYLVNEHDRIQSGDPLLTFDLDLIKQSNLNSFTPVIVTNTPLYLDVLPNLSNGIVTHGEQPVLTIIN